MQYINHPTNIIVIYHQDEKEGMRVATNLSEKNVENVYLLRSANAQARVRGQRERAPPHKHKQPHMQPHMQPHIQPPHKQQPQRAR